MYLPVLRPHPTSRHRRDLERGFTLVELAVVVVIIGIFATLAVPQVTRQMRDRRVRQAAQEVASLYRQARLRAMGRGGAVNVRYVPGGDGHGIFTVQDAVIGSTDVNTACAVMPSPSCSATNWTNNTGTARLARTYDGGIDSGADDIYIKMNQPGTTTAASDLEVCFTPMGRTFSRLGQTATFSPLTNVVTGEIARQVGSSAGATLGLTRRFVMLPSGVARIATGAP